MRNNKFIVWKRSVLNFLHLPDSVQSSRGLEKELSALAEVLANYHRITIVCEIRVSLSVAKQVRAKLIWILVPEIKSFNSFYPDKRILTHRLLGKPASGPSPPDDFSFHY